MTLLDELSKLAGVFAPISTPFAQNEDVDVDALRFNLGRYADSGLLGYLALGSNGENRSLAEAESWNLDRSAGNPALAQTLRDAIYARFPDLPRKAA